MSKSSSINSNSKCLLLVRRLVLSDATGTGTITTDSGQKHQPQTEFVCQTLQHNTAGEDRICKHGET